MGLLGTHKSMYVLDSYFSSILHGKFFFRHCTLSVSTNQYIINFTCLFHQWKLNDKLPKQLFEQIIPYGNFPDGLIVTQFSCFSLVSAGLQKEQVKQQK